MDLMLTDDETQDLVARYCNTASRSPVHDLVERTAKAQLLKVADKVRSDLNAERKSVVGAGTDPQRARWKALLDLADEIEAQVEGTKKPRP